MKKLVIDIARFAMYCCSLLIRIISKVDKHKVFCIANEGKIYGCSPKYISEYILDNSKDFRVYWVFGRHANLEEVDKRIHILKPFSLEYLWAINTAGFVINNFRSRFYNLSWKKRKGQKYIMTWHGPLPLKKIEKDVTTGDRRSYHRIIDKDNTNCDLMLSCSRFTTELIRRAMDYKGEILEEGVPRNDIFFRYNMFESLREKIFTKYGIPLNQKIVLYAPTFRTDHTTDNYNIEWEVVFPSLQYFFGSENFVVLYRIHPDLLIDFNFREGDNGRIKNVSNYPDMQELLCITDLFITDYSSTMFEIALLKRPCILFASDYKTYDRQFYFNLKDLPFPIAEDSGSLAKVIKRFNTENYFSEVDSFLKNEMGLYDKHNASKALFQWMQDQL